MKSIKEGKCSISIVKDALFLKMISINALFPS